MPGSPPPASVGKLAMLTCPSLTGLRSLLLPDTPTQSV